MVWCLQATILEYNNRRFNKSLSHNGIFNIIHMTSQLPYEYITRRHNQPQRPLVWNSVNTLDYSCLCGRLTRFVVKWCAMMPVTYYNKEANHRLTKSLNSMAFQLNVDSSCHDHTNSLILITVWPSTGVPSHTVKRWLFWNASISQNKRIYMYSSNECVSYKHCCNTRLPELIPGMWTIHSEFPPTNVTTVSSKVGITWPRNYGVLVNKGHITWKQWVMCAV